MRNEPTLQAYFIWLGFFFFFNEYWDSRQGISSSEGQDSNHYSLLYLAVLHNYFTCPISENIWIRDCLILVQSLFFEAGKLFWMPLRSRTGDHFLLFCVHVLPAWKEWRDKKKPSSMSLDIGQNDNKLCSFCSRSLDKSETYLSDLGDPVWLFICTSAVRNAINFPLYLKLGEIKRKNSRRGNVNIPEGYQTHRRGGIA